MKGHSHIKTLIPPFTLISLQSACSAFSSVIKLPPYFKQYSSGFHVTVKSANLHISKFIPFSFRVWRHFDLSNVTKPKVENLRKHVPIPNIPIDQLRAQIANLSVSAPTQKALDLLCWRRFRIWFNIANHDILLVVLVLKENPEV